MFFFTFYAARIVPRFYDNTDIGNKVSGKFYNITDVGLLRIDS